MSEIRYATSDDVEWCRPAAGALTPGVAFGALFVSREPFLTRAWRRVARLFSALAA